MIVVDTNIIIYLYIQGPNTTAVEQLLEIDPDWAAPLLWRSEFRNVLALYLRKKIITLSHALNITEQAEYLLDGNEYEPLSKSILALTNSSDCSAYDCEFVSLAKQLNKPLITQDKKILRNFSNDAIELEHFIRINQHELIN